MRRLTLGAAGIETSRLGFGCASLGSRVGADDGRRALEAAFEHGVTWFDLAPAYGRGEAEHIAAAFLRGKRDRVQVATKVGLAAPEAGRGLVRLLMPVARRAIGTMPALRGVLRQYGGQANRKVPLTPDLLQRSLETSLRRLGTDHVDLYALHNADPADLAREDLLRTLEAVLAAGKARAVGVASDETAARAALAASPSLKVVQVPLPSLEPPSSLRSEAAARGFGVIAHSVFAAASGDAGLVARLRADPVLRAQVEEASGTFDLPTAVARLRLARALALLPDGVVLVSMFTERSRRENLQMVEDEGRGQAAAVAERLLKPARAPDGNAAGLKTVSFQEQKVRRVSR